MRLALPLLLAALVLTAASPTGSDRYHRRHCSWQPSKTIYRDPSIRVFRHYFAADDETRTFACLYESNVRRQIAFCPLDDVDDICRTLGGIATEPPSIGFSAYDGSKGYAANYVCVTNLRSRRGGCRETYGLEGFGITRTGSIAWLDHPGVGAAVHKLEAGASRPVELDSGPEVDPESFAVGGHRIYWTHGGAPRTATMP